MQSVESDGEGSPPRPDRFEQRREASSDPVKLEYDPDVDAAYVEVRGPIPPGGVNGTETLDADRLVDYDADDRIIGYEFLSVRRHGVWLGDLEHRAELDAVFRKAGFSVRDEPRPIPPPIRIIRRREPDR